MLATSRIARGARTNASQPPMSARRHQRLVLGLGPMEAEVLTDVVADDQPSLSGRARSLLNLKQWRKGESGNPTVPKALRLTPTEWLKRLSVQARPGTRLSRARELAAALYDAAIDRRDVKAAALILERIDGPTSVQGKGNLTINVQGTVNIGAPVNALPELPGGPDDPDPTRP